MRKRLFVALVVIATIVGACSKNQNSDSVYTLTPQRTSAVWVTSVYAYEDRIGTDLQLGGWGDYYEGYLRFGVGDMPRNVSKVVLQLYVKARKGDKNEIMTGFEIRRVTYTNPIKLKEETKAPETWVAERLSYSMRPSSSFFKNVEVTKEGWINIDITGLYKMWKTDIINHGLHFVPLNNGNTRTVISGPEDEKFRPRVVITP